KIAGEVLKKLDTALCMGVGLSRGVLAEIGAEPTRVYFHHYRTANAFLDQAAFRLAAHIQRKGYLSMPIAASQIVDWQRQEAHLSHKKIGYLAGLGWIGRNNLLVNKALGSQFRLVTVLTNMPVKTGHPLKEGCGACRRCISLCPASAIKDDPAAFDHQKCFEKLKDFQRRRLVDQYICGVCVHACAGKP
ncbi:MAG: hypothetical protein PHR11_02015, partial [Candidatus Omnitrophica bacterium]|nr:hypothetical protein [Candidatus Omnitrophota bacterium]